MNIFQTVEILNSMILAYAAMTIALGILLLLRHLKRQQNFKRIEFTQRIIEQNQEVKKTASKLISSLAGNNNIEFWKVENETNSSHFKTYDNGNENLIADIYSLANFYNTLADGIYLQIYDEDLIRINFEQDIKSFYHYSRPLFRYTFFSDSDQMLLRIEFLILEWDKKAQKKKVTLFG
ncbi:hypothetical protein [Jeotgalibacillus malaysiensis]|uniref:DUF4760 domain-containing protein n=1 Tax=Jeotgalibacillus malaysiensis TaxID=1508404 RepID=UPI00384C0460